MVPFIKKYMNIKNIIVNSSVPPANPIANIIPKTNSGIPMYCITNGKNVK